MDWLQLILRSSGTLKIFIIPNLYLRYKVGMVFSALDRVSVPCHGLDKAISPFFL